MQGRAIVYAIVVWGVAIASFGLVRWLPLALLLLLLILIFGGVVAASIPVLTGILVRFESDKLVMAATDSYRLSVKVTLPSMRCMSSWRVGLESAANTAAWMA